MMKHPKPPPNNLLRQARLRLPSPTAPPGSGKRMSRQELADGVNARLAPDHPDEATLDANHVGKLERGVHRWPSRPRRDAFRHVLGVETDAELGFYITRGLASTSTVTVDANPSDLAVEAQKKYGSLSALADNGTLLTPASTEASPAWAASAVLGYTAHGTQPLRSTGVSAMAGGADMRRRTFLHGVALAARAGATAQGGFTASRLAGPAAPSGRPVDEWLERGESHGRRCMTEPPSEMRSVLRDDLLLLRQRLQADDHSELRVVAAKLSTLYAMTLASLGDINAAIGWYQTAKDAAAASGDQNLAAWVHGREVLRSDYDGYATPEQILTFVQNATSLVEQPSIARMEIMVAAARAYARIGEHRRAVIAFENAKRAYDALPHLTTDSESMYYLPGWRFLLRGAFVSAMAGDTGAVDKVLADAGAGRATGLLRWSVQVELNRALAAARAGEDDTAVALAVPIVEHTPRSQQTQTMRQLVETICTSLKFGSRRDAAVHLRELVATA
jgi:tetratricopeptide (TPR) repeat protein